MELAPTTRRKVCQNCAAAKRRCSVSLPRCARCAQKGLECSYSLEPLPNGTGSALVPQWKGSNKTSDVPLHCFLERVWTLQGHSNGGSRVPVRRDPTGVAYIVWALGLVPSCVVKGKLSPFMHPRLQVPRRHGSHWAVTIDAIRRPEGVHPTDKAFTEVLCADQSSALFEDALDVVQALMLYLIALLCDGSVQDPSMIEVWFAVLSRWVDTLEQRAHDKTVECLSPWQGWLLGESTRRTILTSHIFTCLFCHWKYELPDTKLYMESLPFDGRVGLWQADSPQAWISAAKVRRGENVQTRLVSFHEFGNSRPQLSFDIDGDMFLAMMLIAHNGIDKMVNE